MHTLTTFRAVPPFAVGYVRELRVRWALEEAGLPYQVRLVGKDDVASSDYRQQQPFGQVPVLDDDGLSLFESGSILLHLGEKSPVLLPTDPAQRAQVVTWMFAALNSVEPHVANFSNLVAFSADQAWAIERRPALEEMALKRLRDVDAWLAGRDYLAGGFSVADILMTTVLRLLDRSELVERFAALGAYKARCIARPAFKRALESHMGLYAPAHG
jgi:glutathione S-transferase